jgi:protein-S-isoprenylcysteine O-methyltransferase Ste14
VTVASPAVERTALRKCTSWLAGLLIAVSGSALAVGEWRALLGLALITAALLRKLWLEERFLTKHFGDDYSRYRREVPALVPFIF